MKSIYIKVIVPLLMVCFVFGFVQYSNAAFPGKKEQSKEVTVKSDSNATVKSMGDKKSAPLDDNTILLVILAIIIPPLAVYLKYNEFGKPFIWNVILTLLCGLPGIIHALYHVLKK